jgi:SAM-dependent methyltransferase
VTNVPFEDLSAEESTCPTCGAQGRFRAITHLLSRALYGESIPASTWRYVEKTVYGVSDWPHFERFFARVFRYTNTQFDRDRYPNAVELDVTNPPPALLGTADVVLCSDVLEHVPPPAQPAFDGLYALLKPGGTLIFTVPYSFEPTVEHFPDLYDWKFRERDGRRLVVNRTRAGLLQVFSNLRFHGGGDAVLEMRLFGLPSLMEHFATAGFVDVEVMPDGVPEYGIRLEPWSRPIVARRGLR